MGLRGPTAEFGKRRGAEGQGLEKDSLAGRLEGLAGVTFPGVAGATLPRVRPWASAAQGNLAAGRVARGRKGADKVLLLRPAGELHIAPVGAHCQMPVEDRTRLPPTQGGIGAAARGWRNRSGNCLGTRLLIWCPRFAPLLWALTWDGRS